MAVVDLDDKHAAHAQNKLMRLLLAPLLSRQYFQKFLGLSRLSSTYFYPPAISFGVSRHSARGLSGSKSEHNNSETSADEEDADQPECCGEGCRHCVLLVGVDSAEEVPSSSLASR